MTGGHLKVKDYFQHIRSSLHFVPKIFFAPNSSRLARTLWSSDRALVVEEWEPRAADVWFLAGTDWLAIPEELRIDPPVPVINLIQGARHSEPSDIRYSFLRYPAVRICVSHEVEAGLTSLKFVRGPIYTISNCLDFSGFPLPCPYNERKLDLFIGAFKAPEIGQAIATKFMEQGISICLMTDQVTRKEFLNLLNHSRVALLLPLYKEGFYLPALEAMALETVLVCPDCLGNRSFCIDESNCFRPRYVIEDLIEATRKALSLSVMARADIIRNAQRTSAEHDINIERDSFLRILENIDDIWSTQLY